MMSKRRSRVSRRQFLTATASSAAIPRSVGSTRVFGMDRTPTDSTSQVKPYPLYRAVGTHRELGQQHGEQAKEQIKSHLEMMCSSMRVKREELRRRSLLFQPLFDKYCPHLIDEIRGLAEGADVAFADALATNIRSTLKKRPDGGCTAFVVSGRGTTNRQILIGQNSDMLPAVINLAYVLHLKPTGKPEALMWTFGGMIGYHGINSRGVGHFANDVGGGPKPRFGMPHYPLKRLILESATLEEVQKHIVRLPLWANGNYVLCDGAGKILDIEATTESTHVVRDQGAGYIAHSNHFVCPKHATKRNSLLSAADSFPRLDRMNELIRSRFGKLGVSDFKTFLRDRRGEPNGICRFAQTDDPTAHWSKNSITVASIIAEPANRRLHIAAGNRPTAPFVVYAMDKG